MRHLPRNIALLLLLSSFIVPSIIHAQPSPLRIAAAADLQPILPAIVDQFRRLGTPVEVSFASSATLATQIQNGAPFDLFLSADFSFPQRIIDAGLAGSTSPALYARGTLVLWARRDSPLQPLTLETLRNPRLHTLAVANPDHAPYGRAAAAAIEHLGLTAALKPKLVVAENIAQTAQYVQSGNAELGLISLTSATADALKQSGSYFILPRDLYPPLNQGAIILKRSANTAAAQKFLDYLLSPAIQQQLSAGGLTSAK